MVSVSAGSYYICETDSLGTTYFSTAKRSFPANSTTTVTLSDTGYAYSSVNDDAPDMRSVSEVDSKSK